MTIEYTQQRNSLNYEYSSNNVPEHTMVNDNGFEYQIDGSSFRDYSFVFAAKPTLNLMNQDFLTPLYSSKQQFVQVGPTWEFPACSGSCTN